MAFPQQRIWMIALFAILVVSASAQVVISPLLYEYRDHQPMEVHRASVDGLFIYEDDTTSLPFIDDFSTDKFRKYNAQPGDANVTSTTQIFLYDLTGVNALHDTTCYMTDTTYFITYDSVTVDSLAITYSPLPSVSITVFDSTTYPFTSSLVEVWPPYTVQLTTWNGVQDTLFDPFPDLCQDSATVYFVANIESYSLWIDNFAYRNNRYAVDPPTIGVATLDPLDEEGFPYEFNTLGIYGEADVLTSKPIYMASALDSVYLSFQYQPEGYGNQPEPEDSLVLEFYAPDSLKWYHVWSTPGKNLHDFRRVQMRIIEPQFLKDGFQFRFRNYATLSGALDHWHIDYVYLDDLRSFDDTLMKDFAFRYPSFGLLEEYTAMPWKHFKWNPASYMRNSVTLPAYNGSNDPKFIGPGRQQIWFDGVLTDNFAYTITSPNVAGLSAINMVYEVNSAPNNFVFNSLADDTCATFDVIHALSTSTLPEFLNENDTVRYTQHFENYYAYDDGSAEAAFGLIGEDGFSAKLAYKFTIAQPDTLRSLLMCFVPSVENASLRTFWPTVWADAGGVPGSIIHQSSDLPFHKPIYLDGPNTYAEYYFDNEMPLVSGTYYIGWEQQDKEVLNIGFDRNIDNSDKIFFNVLGTWIPTSQQGSLMIRPVFTSEKDNLTSVENLEEIPVRIYPNPSSGRFVLDGMEAEDAIWMLDISGRDVSTEISKTSFAEYDASLLPAGIYFIRIEKPNGSSQTVRFVKQ